MKNTYVNINNNLSDENDKNTLRNNNINTDINILLNRVKVNKKNEIKKKVFFSAAASAGLIIFGFVIF